MSVVIPFGAMELDRLGSHCPVWQMARVHMSLIVSYLVSVRVISWSNVGVGLQYSIPEAVT